MVCKSDFIYSLPVNNTINLQQKLYNLYKKRTNEGKRGRYMSIGKGMKKGQRTKTRVPSWLLLMEVS